MGISITQCTYGSRRYHRIVDTIISLQELRSGFPLTQLGIAETCIEVGQVTSRCCAILVGEFRKALVACAVALECLLEETLCEIILTLGNGGRSLLLSGF